MEIMVDWTSLYIPYLDEYYTADELTYMFETKYNIGKIKRIDIVRSLKKNVNTAFVHFETWYLNDFNLFLRKELETRGKYNTNAYPGYLLDKIYQNYDCDICKDMYKTKFNAISEEIDDVVFLIHRTKNTHTHSTARISNDVKNTVSNESEDCSNVESIASNLHVQHTLEKHEKRIELLEDQIHVLAESYKQLHV